MNDLQRVGRTKGNAALTVDALRFVADHQALFPEKRVDPIGALTLAHAAGNTARVVSDYVEFRRNEDPIHRCTPSLTRMTTGSPPAGDQTFSTFGSIRRMAASSLAI